MDAINKGYVPREISGNAANVIVNLVDRKEEDYVPPKKVFKPFSTPGRTLGSSSTSTPSTNVQQKSEPITPSIPEFKVDESKPTTSIQIRLHDGARIVAKFNLTHTVGDLIKYVEAASRLKSGQKSELTLQFPRKVLSDPSQTIEQAGLKNAVVVQRLL